MSNTKQLLNISTLRGIAALSVCMFHTAGTGSLHSAGLLDKFSFIFQYGYLGVQVFFVISGFIIPYSLYKSNYTVNTFPKFMLKRYVRIAPAAWVSILMMMLFYWLPVLFFNKYLRVSFPEMYSFKNIPTNLLFIAPFFHVPWILSVLWTLNIEFQYYLFIGILFPIIMGKKTSSYLLIVLFSMSGWVYKIICNGNYDEGAASATLLFYHAPLFCMGIVTFLYKIKNITTTEYFICMFLFLGIGLASMNYPREIIIGFLSALFIIYIQYHNSITSFFGNTSYSLYLNHGIFVAYIDGVFRLLFPQTFNVSANILLIVSYYAMIFFASWVFYFFVERYFHKLAQRI